MLHYVTVVFFMMEPRCQHFVMVWQTACEKAMMHVEKAFLYFLVPFLPMKIGSQHI